MWNGPIRPDRRIMPKNHELLSANPPVITARKNIPLKYSAQRGAERAAVEIVVLNIKTTTTCFGRFMVVNHYLVIRPNMTPATEKQGAYLASLIKGVIPLRERHEPTPTGVFINQTVADFAIWCCEHISVSEASKLIQLAQEYEYERVGAALKALGYQL